MSPPPALEVHRPDIVGGVGRHARGPIHGQRVGLEPLEGLRWRLWFRDIDLGFVELLPEWFDHAAAEGHRNIASTNKKNTNESSETAA